MALKDAEHKRLDSGKLRELTDRELEDELARLKEARFRLKFRSATEAIDNPSQFRMLRRNIARIETVLRERK
ncbi:MAG: 50S ribosomal protein L29 [Gemmatimonadota bacterium]|nr:50S ribosomal protein L29 [Gemmatimonadota bacterium]MDH3366626.1 50S ribosomal protein L29 [Gemmatimonadota bacterium]MDH3477235.1 50S ribosomal protein L29 [Gemmatimonadota bacterium]MDH3569798.1 50S ribosomal protein L29 [Gemmatimonadota bacterium]MDH5551067.1 50S ribosomal protein L29 [Gemmatimonadota bacterium]